MSAFRWLILAFAALAFGCATPAASPDDDDLAPSTAPAPSPAAEYPSIEPVEPPLPPPETEAPDREVQPVPEVPPAVVPPSATVPPRPPITVEEQDVLMLVADLQRYGTLGPDEQKRERDAATQALARQRSDGNRIRLAVLYTMARTSPQDDQRALQLLDNVAHSNPGSPMMKQLAAVLQVQVAERVRAVRDEQQKTDAALQKLEDLKAMERSLLRDRIRGLGGGSSSGGGGSGSGGGGGGGGGR
jgi:isochorismate hydrolase